MLNVCTVMFCNSIAHQELEKLITDLQELVSLYEDLVELRTKTEPKKRRIENTTVVAVPSEAQAESETLAPAAVDVKNLKPLLNRSCYAFYEGIVYTATVIEVHPVTETEVSLISFYLLHIPPVRQFLVLQCNI